MSRLPAPDRNGLPPEDQAVRDRIATVRGGVGGPFGVLMHVPQLADHVGALEDCFRFDGELPAAYRELVILVTAREMEACSAWPSLESRFDPGSIHLYTSVHSVYQGVRQFPA